MRDVSVQTESLKLKTPFRIARNTVNSIDVVTVTISQDGYTGFGECRPYSRYQETPDSVEQQIQTILAAIRDGASREDFLTLMPAGAARNAVDAALWDLEAKLDGIPAWQKIGIEGGIKPVEIYRTLSLDTPDNMAKQAKSDMAHQRIKLKLGGDLDAECIRAVRAACPDADLAIDVNEGWDLEQTKKLLPIIRDCNFNVLEQPLKAGTESHLKDALQSEGVWLCADESIHTIDDLEGLKSSYDMVNIKLDKTGGLTHALQVKARARALGFKVLVGCMVSSSLALAPAILLAQDADMADINGASWLENDRQNGQNVMNGSVHAGALWGQP